MFKFKNNSSIGIRLMEQQLISENSRSLNVQPCLHKTPCSSNTSGELPKTIPLIFAVHQT